MFEIPSAPAAAYVVAVMFSGSQDRYDYLVPANRRVSVGDVVNVETRRGIASVVVVEVMAASAKATKFILPE